MGVITFNGVSSEHYGINVEREPDYEYPERDYEIVHVPGRNGDIVVDKGSYKNTTRSYNIAVGSVERNFTDMAKDILKWLHSSSGYARLEDSYEPDFFRLAMCKETGTVTNIFGHAGRCTIKFNCKPQRFLKTGERNVTFTRTGSLVNPTGFEALPTIKVYGNGDGVLSVGGDTVTISGIDSFLVLDSEVGDVYKNSQNMNSRVVFSNGFPTLKSGTNSVSFSGNITKVEVMPRWWTL